MVKNISEFKKTKPLLVCIDSDGCAMNTMESKHRECFGPMAVKTWPELQAIESEFLDLWNEINLYSGKRGINRFMGIVEAFKQMEAMGYKVPPWNKLEDWTKKTQELSASALNKAYEESPNEQFASALKWSEKVNASITLNAEKDKPFEFVKETLEKLHEIANIAIVSSANSGAIEEEWARNGLADYVDIMCGQESGTKQFCIGELKKERNYAGYEVLMIGDALGDYEAARVNGILYYPIIPHKENDSWKSFFDEGMQHFVKNTYMGTYEDNEIQKFKDVLK